MKKCINIMLFLLCATGVSAENKIQMVTYFPVPYVAYSKVNVQRQMDIGLFTTCDARLGCSESGAAGLRPLRVSAANLNKGKLSLDSAQAVGSMLVTMGENAAGNTTIDFTTNLRINTLEDGYSLQTNAMTLDVLKLFPDRIKNDFPSCASTGASGAPQVSWRQLKLKNQKETFLVCGNSNSSTESDCSNDTYARAHPDECCSEQYDFFYNNHQFCCSNMTNIMSLENWYDCCKYPAAFSKIPASCCGDETVPNNDLEYYCYDAYYEWRVYSEKVFTITSCEDSIPCWERSPAADYRSCQDSCNESTLGNLCWENNGDPDSCGLNRVPPQPGVVGFPRCYTYRGSPLMQCVKELTPIYW